MRSPLPTAALSLLLPVAAPVARPSLQQAAPTAADAAAKLCAAPAAVAIVDHFTGVDTDPDLDVDGDGKPDLAHGDALAGLYRAAGRATKAYALGGVSLQATADAFSRVADDVEAGKPVAAVNFSQEISVPWAAINRELGVAPPAITAETVGARRAEVLAGVRALMRRREDESFEALVTATTRLSRLGVPIFGIAGNNGPGKVNLMNLLPGVVVVGGLRPDGTKMAVSEDNSLVDLWALGEHAFGRAPGGVSIDGDGRADFPASALSGGPAFVDGFVGQPVADAVTHVPADPELDPILRDTPGGVEYLRQHMPDALFPREELIAFFKLPALRAEAMRQRGLYFDKTLRYAFGADAAGRIAFDPAGTGAPGQVLLMSGTSFAPPSLCGLSR